MTTDRPDIQGNSTVPRPWLVALTIASLVAGALVALSGQPLAGLVVVAPVMAALLFYVRQARRGQRHVAEQAGRWDLGLTRWVLTLGALSAALACLAVVSWISQDRVTIFAIAWAVLSLVAAYLTLRTLLLSLAVRRLREIDNGEMAAIAHGREAGPWGLVRTGYAFAATPAAVLLAPARLRHGKVQEFAYSDLDALCVDRSDRAPVQFSMSGPSIELGLTAIPPTLLKGFEQVALPPRK
jgi:hypothetical protein